MSTFLGAGLTTATGQVAALSNAELIEAMASEAGITEREASAVLDAFLNATTKALKKGDRLSLAGFGSFSISKRSARTGRNPQTGKEIQIAAKNSVLFTASDELTAALDLIPGEGDERRLGRRRQKPKQNAANGRQNTSLLDVDRLAGEAKVSPADAKKALDGFINATTKALKKGDRLSLIGFGSFSISKRSARTGRNPQTGKEIQIAAKSVVKFKAGAELSKAVN
jgi:nucleoid DNA-binding protein